MLDWLCICQSAFNVLSVAEQRSIDYSFVPLMYSVFTNSLGDLHLMQFTGLLDSQGIEIYEGDIVVKNEYIWFCDGEPNYRGTVEWIYSQWQVVSHCVNPEKRGISDGINRGLNDDGVEDGDKSEWIVIGNIHQHPELLK